MKTIRFQGRTITPSKIICIGKNYADHIAELNDAAAEQLVIFNKPNSALSDAIYTHATDEIHYEAEISFLIQNKQFVGVAIGLDLTKRLVQKALKEKGLPWERAKAFDNSAVFSEVVPLTTEIADLRLELWINQQLIQSANYELMLTKPHEALADIQAFLTVEDGDMLMTGTPKGVGKVNVGDVFHGKLFDKNRLLIEQQWTAK